MKVWPVLKWMLLIAVAVVVLAGVGSVWLWTNSDHLIRQQVLKTFDKASPDLQLQVDGLQFVSTSSLRITGVQIRDRETRQTILRAREVIATVDETALIENHNVILRSIHINGIEVLLQRSETGRWNWQEYKFQRISDNPLIPPSVILENVRAQIQLEHGSGIPPANLIVTSPSFHAVPKSAEVYDFTGSLALPGAGSLALNGTSNLVTREWNLRGQLASITADQSLMEIAKSTAPQLAEQLQQLDAKIARVLPAPVETRTTDSSPTTSAIVVGASGVSPRFMGVLDIDFQIEKRSDLPVPDLRLKVEVRDGQLSSPVVPVRLSDVRDILLGQSSGDLQVA